jgi:tetratricopeptide (TPR) repeat protein
MARVPNEPTELDPDDLLDEIEENPEPKTIKRDSSKPKTKPRSVAKVAAAAAPNVKISVPPPLPRKAPAPAGFPDAETMVADARRRADAAGRITDRVALARARIELAVILEVVKRDPNGALAEYRAAHAIAPSALAPIAAARRLTPLRPVPAALSILEAELRATSDGPTRAVRLLELGRLLLAGGAAPEKAVQAFRDVLVANPDHPGGLRGLERALRALPRALETTSTLEAIASHLETMASAWSSDRVLSAWLGVERAAILEKLRRPDAARTALEGALELASGIGPVRDAYTRHLIAHDETKRLVDAWTTEAGLEGDSARGGRLLYSAARLASERLEQISMAIELHRRATALQNTPLEMRRAALSELVRLYGTTGAAEDAVEAEKQLLLWIDDSERAYRHKRLAQALEELGHWPQVAEHAKAALAFVPDDEETRERLDRALEELGRHEQRVSLWTAESSRATTVSARTAALRRAAEIAELNLGRADIALVEMRAAWAIDPEDTEIADAIARLLTTTSPPNPDDPDDPARARARIDFYSEAAAKTADPSRRVAYLEKLAQIWEDEVRSPKKALEVYLEVLATEPERRSAMLGLERNAARAGESRELFRALVLEADHSKNPTLERSLLLRAAEIASGALADADTALDLVRRVLAKNAGDPLALRAACRVHQRTGRHDEALAQLRLLLTHTRKGPAAFGVAIDIATLLEQRLRRRDEALAAYREAHRIDPNHPLAGAEIRRILLANGDFRELAEELTSMAAAATSPESKTRLLLEAAEIYVDRLDEIDRASSLLVQARALSPDDVVVAERLERVYERQNKVGELVALLDAKPEKTQEDQLALGLVLAEDRDIVRASRVFAELLAADPKHVAAQRSLELALGRTDRFAELASVLRLQAATFESPAARLGAISELVVIEEHRGIAAPAGAPTATELLRAGAPEDILLHEAVLRTGLSAETPAEVARVTSSLSVLAASSPDPHHAATLELIAALLLERTAQNSDHQMRADALRRYRLVLDAWPECLTAARGIRRLAERLGDPAALIESAAALGNLETDAVVRAERLVEAAEGIIANESNILRGLTLFARALGEDPESARAVHGLLSLAFDGPDPGLVADALRRALERTTQPDHAVRIGAGLAKLAFERLGDPTVALEALRRVRKKAPGNVRNLLNLAEASMSIKLFADAAEIASSAIGITRDPAERLRATVILALAQAEIPDGKANAKREAHAAEKLAETAPGEARAELLTRLSTVYSKLDENDASLRVLAQAVLHGGKAKKPLELLATACSASTFDGAKAFAQAIAGIMDRARKLEIPVEASWIAALGKLEATVLAKPRDGVARIKEAILLEPDRMETYESLTEVYAALGAHEESVKELLAILPDVAARGVGSERLLPLFGLLSRECKLARKTAQAFTADAVALYLKNGSVGTLKIPPSVPTPMSLAGPALFGLVGPDTSRPWLEVAGALLELMPKVLRVDPFALGLSPRDRIPPRAPHPTRALCDRFARAFGEPRFDLFVDAASVGVPRIVPSDPPAIVLPRGYGDLADNEQAAGICRLLVYIALNVPWLEDLGAGDLEGFFFGAMRVGQDGWQDGVLAKGPDSNAELWRPRIAKIVARKHKRALEEIALRTTSYVNPEAFRYAVRRASVRAAYAMTGDLPSTLNHLLRTDRELSQVARADVANKLLSHPLSRDLLFFALGAESLTLRRTVGTA